MIDSPAIAAIIVTEGFVRDLIVVRLTFPDGTAAMVKITPGTSGRIRVTFPYSPELVAKVRAIKTRRWHPILDRARHLFRLKHYSARTEKSYLPYALERKYSNASLEWGWQYVFPARGLSKDTRTGEIRRHHIHENGLQKAVKAAARLAGVDKPVSVHAFRSLLRHPFAGGEL